MATARTCKHSPDTFCYVCGCYIAPKQIKHRIKRGTKVWSAYQDYFGMAIGDQDKLWAPHFYCGSCRSTLEAWKRGTRQCMPFAIPRIWKEPKNHTDDCYFCMVDISKYTTVKGRKHLIYPNISSSIAPVPHDNALEIPVTSQPHDISDESSDANDQPKEWYSMEEMLNDAPHFPNQEEVDDLVRDLQLTKSNAELLASRLNEWNLLDSSCKTTSYRKRHVEFSIYFTVDETSLCYCSDIKGLFQALGFEHRASEWRLFIDSSSKSLKAVLLHNGNNLPSIPVGHSANMKENYTNIKYLMQQIKYTDYMWDVCGDFKMIGFMLGLQGGYTKHSCFLCLWDSRADTKHYTQRDWPGRQHLIPGSHNVIHRSLVPRTKVLLPPLHIKLSLIKQFTKALDFENRDAFQHMRLMFPKLSEAKLKGGIFIGPDVTKMLASRELENKMNLIEKNAWQALRRVVEGFLGNTKVENYRELIEDLITHYRNLGCRMSIKLHYLYSHLDFFSPNMGDISDEHGERFHQEIKTMENRYAGKWNATMMGDYAWSIVRSQNTVFKRKSRSNVHF